MKSKLFSGRTSSVCLHKFSKNNKKNLDKKLKFKSLRILRDALERKIIILRLVTKSSNGARTTFSFFYDFYPK